MLLLYEVATLSRVTSRIVLNIISDVSCDEREKEEIIKLSEFNACGNSQLFFENSCLSLSFFS